MIRLTVVPPAGVPDQVATAASEPPGTVLVIVAEVARSKAVACGRGKMFSISYVAGVDFQVLEGALVEVPTADVTGVDRRAFGEFVGPRGELASYAFGWTTGSDPHVAHLSIGIGAGNPGGGTFHAVIFANDDGHAFSLTDEPFERVPQGGPDLTADQSRAHEDLPFVWWVTDHVLQHDRRAWWMRHWLLSTTCCQTFEVFERHEPVLKISHDAGDGVWRLIGASDTGGNTGKVGHLHHGVDEEPSLVDVLDLPPGRSAVRADVGKPWTVHR